MHSRKKSAKSESNKLRKAFSRFRKIFDQPNCTYESNKNKHQLHR